jgi:hypothetical protein
MNEVTDRMRLKKRFADLAEDVLPGEGFPDDEITDAMIRAVCFRIGNHAETLAWVKDIADQWFEGEEPRNANATPSR